MENILDLVGICILAHIPSKIHDPFHADLDSSPYVFVDDLHTWPHIHNIAPTLTLMGVILTSNALQTLGCVRI